MSNLDLWEKVEKTDPKHTKKVTFGRGFTAIDPYYQIKCATEQFGAAGQGWGWEVVRVEEFREIKSIGLLIRLWHGNRDDFIEQWGQSGMYTDKAQTKPDNDMLKKATTDGITKCLSYLGFNADVFTGKFDDNKYVQQMKHEFEQVDPKPIDQDKVSRATEFFIFQVDQDISEDARERNIKEGWGRLSPDEMLAVNEGLKDKAPGTNKMYKSIVRGYAEL